MVAQFSISDVSLLALQPDATRLVVLRDDDHLLRRFGQVEARQLPAGAQTPYTLRSEADEVWACLQGAVVFQLIDLRQGSPSERQEVEIELQADQPHALLIPFGVAYALATEAPAHLLRLATHADGTHADDREIPAKDLKPSLPEA